jgi:hypothetical protein
MDATRSALERSLAPQGLRVLGGFVPGPAEGLPRLPSGASAAVVWMVGQVGSEVWPAFAASAIAQDGQPDPMDRWSQAIGDDLARSLGGHALYPSDGPPWWPFQQWMARCAPGSVSAMMLRIHPDFGLWQACRFALVLPRLAEQDAAVLALPAAADADICLQCSGKPCLGACPVSAYSVAGFAVQACAGHLHTEAGVPCMEQGCLARRACPVGAGYRYDEAHAAFHMAAFAGRRRSPQAG